MEQHHKLRQQHQLFQQQMQLSIYHQQQQQQRQQQSYYRPDLRISSFQQITPPESLAFWQQQQQQQQQMAAASLCRSAGCNGQHPVAGYTKYSPPVAPAPLCYPMPPTPMMTVGGRAAPPPFCLGCAQCARTGKPCQQVNKENTLGIMRSL